MGTNAQAHASLDLEDVFRRAVINNVLGESTAAQYTSRIRGVCGQLQMTVLELVSAPDRVHAFVTSRGTPRTAYSTLVAVIAYMKAANMRRHDAFGAHYARYHELARSVFATISRSTPATVVDAPAVTPAQLRALSRFLETTSASSKECLAVAMLVHLPPKRAKVYSRLEITSNFSKPYCVCYSGSGPGTLKVGMYREQLPKPLDAIIRASYAARKRRFLFEARPGSPYTEDGFRKYISATLFRCLGVPDMTLQKIREAYLYELSLGRDKIGQADLYAHISSLGMRQNVLRSGYRTFPSSLPSHVPDVPSASSFKLCL